MEILKYVVIVLLMCSLNTNAQISFHRIYTGEGYDFGYDLLQVEDSSYYLCGSSSSFPNSSSQAFLLNTNVEGVKQWSVSYGGNGSEAFTTMDRLADSTIFLGGYSTSDSNGDFDGYLVQVDYSGSVLWDTIYGGENWDRVIDVVALNDSGFVVLAETRSFGPGGSDWWLQRFDKQKHLIWEEFLGADGDDEPKRCLVYDDSLYISGNITNAVTDTIEGRVFKFDLNGNQIWSFNAYDHFLLNSSINAIDISHDRVLLGGMAYENVEGSSDLITGTISIYDGNGSPFLTDFQGFQNVNAMALSNDSNNVYVNVQSANSPEIGNAMDGSRDSFVYKYTYAFGFSGFSFTYSKNFDDVSYNMINTLDGGIAYVGYQEFYSNGVPSVCFVKIGSNDELYPSDQPLLESVLSIYNENTLEAINIYPNPVNELLFIDTEVIDNVKLFNSVGKQVEFNGNASTGLDVSSLSKGVYFVCFSDKDGYFRRFKFFKN